MIERILFCLLCFAVSLPAPCVLISHALEKSTGRVVMAESVERKGAPFLCFECGNELVLRRGQLNVAHFAHKIDPNSKCGGGGPESWQHKLAKQLLSEHLHEWHFETRCSDCNNRMSSKRYFKSKYEAQIEHHFFDFYVDVMVMRQNKPFAAIEVRYSHPVDDNKKAFFKSRFIPILEVDAEQVISAHEKGSFRAIRLNSKRCSTCEEKEILRNSNICLQCKRWYKRKLMEEIAAPPEHVNETAFVCKDCQALCPDCDSIITQVQLDRYKRCYACNQTIIRWKIQADKAINEKQVAQMELLIKTAPKEVDIRFLQNFYKKTQGEIEQQRAFLLAQKQEAQKNYERLQAERENKRRLQLKEQAKEIVQLNKVELRVPYHQKEQVKCFEARWDGKYWSVPAKHIRACSHWLVDRELVPLVETILEAEQKNRTRKRKRSDIIEFDPKRRCITDYFSSERQ